MPFPFQMRTRYEPVDVLKDDLLLQKLEDEDESASEEPVRNLKRLDSGETQRQNRLLKKSLVALITICIVSVVSNAWLWFRPASAPKGWARAISPYSTYGNLRLRRPVSLPFANTSQPLSGS